MNSLPGLIVAATLLGVMPAAIAAPKDPVASAEVQKEFAAFIDKFRAALKANDLEAVVNLSKMPFLSHTDEYSAEAFRTKVYKREFTARTRACIQSKKATYDHSPDNTESYSIFCGDEIFMFTKMPAGFLFTEIGVND
ncbi:hypothetical protein [Bradyrhizobium prioriisuperbiae]|uniref:hypothetical protein n=1 Tax=Bradyrhizobium prioriisuperbiae TaxID=2854389 RepID=UPI0028EED7D7|nr:hypothetical protein [Bradyrhizobium prioritasuperba]